MYTITIKNLSDSFETSIYESNSNSNFIEKPSLSLEWQQPGSLSFTIIPGHPSYNDVKPIITFVYVYRDNEEIFFGRVLTVDRELFGKKDVYCEGALNFLTDGQLLHSCDQTMTVTNFMIWCMNEMIGSGSDPDTIEARKQFVIGDIDSSLGSQSAHFKTEEYAEPKSTLDEQLINRFGGCFVIRKETRPGVYSPSGHSISYLKTVGNVSSEKIRLCENVRDRTDHDSGESIFTILRPIGANTGGDNDEPCKLSTNGGVIEISAMIAKYGRICKTENFSDQDTESGLLAAAQAYIARLGMANDTLPKTCDIKFVDFHHLNPQITTIGFGDVFTDIEGYENQTMVVGHLELDLENPANDSLSLYNQTYLDAREYSALLESSTGAASTKNSSTRSSSGGGGSAIAKTLAGAAKTADDKTTEVESHFKHLTSETNRELHDNFGIIGVKLDPNTHLPMKDSSGNYIWAGPDDAQAEIWENFQRSAWETIIENVVKDGRGNVLSIGQVSTSADGQVFINAINDSRTGTAKINANRLKINTTSGSSFSIDSNGNIVLDANNTLTNINNTATLTLSASKIDIDGVVNALSTRSLTALNVTVANAITAGSLWLRHQASQSSPVQTSSVLDHYHQLNCDSQGNVTTGAAVWSQPTSNFNIANTQFFNNCVLAAENVYFDPDLLISLSTSDLGQTVYRDVYVYNNYDSTSKLLTVPISVPSIQGPISDAKNVYFDPDLLISLSTSDLGQTVYRDVYVYNNYDSTSKLLTVPISVPAGQNVNAARLLVRRNSGALETELINGQRVTLAPEEYCEVDIEYNGSYIKWGEVAAPSGGVSPVQIFYCNESLADGKAKIQFSDGSYSEYNLTLVGWAPYNNM